MNKLKILKLTFSTCLLVFMTSCRTTENNPDWKILSVSEYRDAVYASWIGQIIGNTYGLCYEFKFIEQPGPDSFPYGYTWTLDKVKEYNGAFSDDDTDLEYMYLTIMEKEGIEPTYSRLAEAWKTHIKERIWCANQAALTLMHAGHYPPVTGSVAFNTQWMQIDPQLINEIWAVTAPGMIGYAIQKSEFMARITNDSFGIEPTLHYAAMYSAAFFEKDIRKLIDIGISALPEGSRFAKIVEHVKQLYAEYPDDWITARQIVKDNYLVYGDYNRYAWPPIDANLNGAMGIMALLYGGGDFQKTLDYTCAFGMDADNQAATMCGLLGIVSGLEAIPRELMFPLNDTAWELPFNDLYKMVTREGLEDASLTSMAERIADQGEKIILAKGGRKIGKGRRARYIINQDASFTPPFELNPLPELSGETGRSFSYPVYTGGGKGTITLEASGELPPGIALKDSKLEGIPLAPGDYRFEISAAHGNKKKSIPVRMKIFDSNLAPEAAEILFNTNSVDRDIGKIRDGKAGETYYSIKEDGAGEQDFYGYLWDEPARISALIYNCGMPQESGGWFTTFDVEYLKGDRWIRLEEAEVYPEMNLDNSQWLKPAFVDYRITFEPVTTKGIRIIGQAGGITHYDAGAEKRSPYYTAISELKVYP